MEHQILLTVAVVGGLFGLVVGSLVNVLVLYALSGLNLGIRVHGFLWTLLAGATIGITTSILWHLTRLFVSFDSHPFVHILAYVVISALGFYVTGFLLSKHFEVDGFGGALIAAISSSVLMFIIGFLAVATLLGVGLGVVAHQAENGNTESLDRVIDTLRPQLLKGIVVTVPETQETIHFNGEKQDWSQGYVLIGDIVRWTLPNGTMITTLDVNTGGNANDVYLAVFESEGTEHVLAQSSLLGEYASDAIVSDISVDGSEIRVTYRVPDPYGNNAPEVKTNVYRYENGNLTLLSGDSGMGSEPLPALEGTFWKWEGTQMNNDTTLTPPANSSFILTFNENGSMQATTDCNTVSGSYGYNAATGQITFERTVQTLKLCPNAMEERYVAQLASVDRVMFDGDKMYLNLMLDGGTMTYTKQ